MDCCTIVCRPDQVTVCGGVFRAAVASLITAETSTLTRLNSAAMAVCSICCALRPWQYYIVLCGHAAAMVTRLVCAAYPSMHANLSRRSRNGRAAA
eukprot:311379-Chlamydomonas_euryale.AAC.8